VLTAEAVTNTTVLGWNNLGMHCMDNDFSVFCILPPYNTIHAQLVVGTNSTARLVTNVTNFSITYQAVGDSTGSTNSTSIGKGNFWQYAGALFGTNLPQNTGLPVPTNSFAMPGPANTPQSLLWETNSIWFAGYGIPITPYDDTQRKNTYPLMRLVAKRISTVLTNLDIVLPVSDEMDCRACHGSGTVTNARPSAGWVWDPNPTRDYRLNILRLHDQLHASSPTYTAALASNSYNSAGLYANVTVNNEPILCAACHKSEALPGSGILNIKPLTEAVHANHANVTDPTNGQTLNSVNNRSACYRCHPGSETRCLRGAMGDAIAADGSMAMQCQSCHGNMSAVGAAGRKGWLDEPNCQSCHVGVSGNSYGVIRFTNALTNGVLRAAADQTFATDPNTPTNGASLFRFSRGHGNLYCSACHGSPHAEFPSANRNDNVTSTQLQGHIGMLSKCDTCHGGNPTFGNGGPHGMHPIGTTWRSNHKDYVDASCENCHGGDSTGTVLSRSHRDQTLGGVSFWRGRTIGCYDCHDGPAGGGSASTAPTASSVSTNTPKNVAISFNLPVSVTNVRIVLQPDNGRVGIVTNRATYYPDTAFVGTNRFTFCSNDGTRDSNLATGTVVVAGGVNYALVPTSQNFNELGGAASVTVNVSGGTGQWSAASDHRWITILSSANTNITGEVRYCVERNTNALPRYGSITIAGLAFVVAQSGAPADGDGDGLPDTWESAYSVSDPNADNDGDGFSNLQEYLAGTNPTQPNEAPRISNFIFSGGVFRVSFPTVTNKYYQIQRRDDLLTGSWVGFTNAFIGTGGTVQIPDSDAATQLKRFYRILLVP